MKNIHKCYRENQNTNEKLHCKHQIYMDRTIMMDTNIFCYDFFTGNFLIIVFLNFLI